MLYAGGFTQNDRKQWRVVIFTNLVHAFQVILSAMEEQGVDFEYPNNEVSFIIIGCCVHGCLCLTYP